MWSQLQIAVYNDLPDDFLLIATACYLDHLPRDGRRKKGGWKYVDVISEYQKGKLFREIAIEVGISTSRARQVFVEVRRKKNNLLSRQKQNGNFLKDVIFSQLGNI
jgi:hypothetical protein